MSKYDKLYEYLKQPVVIELYFDEINSIIGGNGLPESAFVPGSGFWRNEIHGHENNSPQVSAWYQAGYDVDQVNYEERMVKFRLNPNRVSAKKQEA
ncbi:hypothetical protein FHS18_001165 [Paenibacillus phyllosphaerae]|uniref:DUF7662 domain-containing protein n=1 Tax=Paenibacillus phyllosphaerae TaxID=274593 RepID=A0A7W5AUP5_9BACL|nr:hypothetical protein [Paenibacillus phyllosphaerae]MBB3109113.1 hypothetical protein [Paenibacillus phyllosphaerae]